MSCVKLNKIALGTVQFGLAYGIANQSGKVERDEADRILQAARKSGIDTLDTAIAYGDSEKTLGQLNLDGFNIISKLPGVPDSIRNVHAWVEDELSGSLERLGVSRLHALLLHRPEQLLGAHGQELYETLRVLREQGVVEKIGVSVYEPAELECLVGHMKFDLVQAPFNLLDRRLIETGWLTRLHESGIELHVRSIFMQGLLLMSPESRPSKFNRWSGLWQTWEKWLSQTGQTPLQACLRYVLSFPEISRIVLGVDNQEQLQQIICDADDVYLSPPVNLHCNDVELLNPSLWNRL